MKILYVHQFFNTPTDGGSLRSYYLASAMVKSGFEVTMITSHTGLERKVNTTEGIKVIYLPIRYDNSFGFWKRIVAYFSFTFLAILESVKEKKVDICYIMTTPLSTGFIALFNRIFLFRPYIFEVGDLWPLVPIQMGIIKNPLIKSFSFWFEKMFYRFSKGSVGLSAPITTYISKKSPNTPLETIYNMADCTFFQPQNATSELKSKYGIKEELVITYTGTFGLANDLIRMIDLIHQIQHLPIKFLFIGMGAEKEKIKSRVNELALTNCEILDFQKKQGMKEILAVSDAMFISFANYDALFTGSPNKLFDALAAGKLVITNFGGWVSELIVGENCGFSFIHDSAEDFANKIQPFLQSREMIVQFQSNARALAERDFELNKQAEKLINFIKKLT